MPCPRPSRREFVAAVQAGTAAALAGCWNLKRELGALPDPEPVRVAAPDWPQGRSDPGRSGANRASEPPALDDAWTTSPNLTGATAPVLGTTDAVYVATAATEKMRSPAVDASPAKLYALSKAGDDVAWTARTPPPGANIAAGHGWLYFPTAEGTVEAYDAAGVRHHRADLPTGGPVAATVGTDSVYVWSGDGSVVALSPDLGEQRWTWSGADRWVTVAVAGDRLVVSAADAVYGLSTDGQQTWRFDAGGAATSGRPVSAVADGTAYVVPGDGTLTAIDVSTGVETWTRNLDGSASLPAVADNIYLVVDGNGDGGRLTAVQDDGTLAWERTGIPVAGATPVVGGDSVYVVGDSTAYRWRRSDGHRIAATKAIGYLHLKASSPVVHDGTLRLVLTGFESSAIGVVRSL